jgi:DNA-binding NarL/FixJ family response regulator
VLIVDGQPVMRFGLIHLIASEPDLMVSGEADTAAQALNLISARPPDLVLLDIALPDRSGLELLKDIHVFHPGLPTLVFSVHDESIYAERVLRAGGRGYVMKQESSHEVLRAIRQVLEGRIYVSERISAKILETFSGQQPESDSKVERLSDREFQVLQRIAQGEGSRQIAERLNLSAKTVEVHRANIRRKLKLKGGAELMRYAIRWTEARVAD